MTSPWLFGRLVGIAGFMLLWSACSEGPDSESVSGPSYGKAPAGLAVKSVDPDSVRQDTTLNIRVLGSGFDASAQAAFLLNGASDPKVRTNSTRFVSSTEVVANVTIALDAEPDLYDAQVTLLSSGRKGIGTEKLAVLPYVELGSLGGTFAQAEDVENGGIVVGKATTSSGEERAFFWTAGEGIQALPRFLGDVSSNATGIGANGVIVGSSGVDPDRRAVRWVPDGLGSWTVEPFSLPSGTTTSYMTNLEETTLEAVGEFYFSSSSLPRAIYWASDGSAIDLHAKPFFGGRATMTIGRGLNAHGIVVGEASGGSLGAFAWAWDKNTDVVRELPRPSGCTSAAAWSVNNKAEVAGYCRSSRESRLLVWRRQADGSWGLPQELDRDASLIARDINDAGFIVGRKSGRPFVYKPGQGVEYLIGVPGFRNGIALRLSDAPNPQVAGALSGPTGVVAVRWTVR